MYVHIYVCVNVYNVYMMAYVIFKSILPKSQEKTTTPQFYSQLILVSFFCQNHSGSKHLEPVQRPPLCPSMHRSQIKLGSNKEKDAFVSDHMATYHEKEIIPVKYFIPLSSLIPPLPPFAPPSSPNTTPY